MMIDRRNVIVGTALAAVAPALSFASALVPTPAAEATRWVVKIDGWSVSAEADAAEEIWIRVNRSWRAAWR
jgi:hypothetical protein